MILSGSGSLALIVMLKSLSRFHYAGSSPLVLLVLRTFLIGEILVDKDLAPAAVTVVALANQRP